MARGTTPVLDAAAEINAVSLARTELDPRTLMITRIAALVAVDAPVGSYLLHVGPAAEVGLTVDDIQDVLVAVARSWAHLGCSRRRAKSQRPSTLPSNWALRPTRTELTSVGVARCGSGGRRQGNGGRQQKCGRDGNTE